MAKKMKIQKGILSTPSGTERVIEINKLGVIKIARSNKTNVKRPNQYK